MSNYQVLARKYRPQSFFEILGQDAIVTTLKNAIAHERLAHAYMFCGSRGTGKTTLARVFAKALNCQSSTKDGEPCSACSSCKEIAVGNSLDVLEIDGASHRGIDDIRQINETVAYASSAGKYKIYIIDEVHMLTKEAFNALLKTLEEPPAKVIFLFATTEPHKVLPTILSRCQRFNLNRIPSEKIIDKLRRIAHDQHIEVEDEALFLLAQRADGGLRDAESLFDQMIAFNDGKMTVKVVTDVLGLMPKAILFELDKAGKEGRLAIAFEIAHQIISQGKNLIHFVESLTEHFRTLLLIKLSGPQGPFLNLLEEDLINYEASARLYSSEQCLNILDFLIEEQHNIRFQSFGRIALEALLMRIIRTHHKLPIEFLVRRLAELEQSIQQSSPLIAPSPSLPAMPLPLSPEKPATTLASTPKSTSALSFTSSTSSTSEDPTPTPEDLGLIKNPSKEKQAAPPLINSRLDTSQENSAPKAEKAACILSEIKSSSPQDMFSATSMPPNLNDRQIQLAGINKQSHYDTLLQFAAVELEGTIQKKLIK